MKKTAIETAMTAAVLAGINVLATIYHIKVRKENNPFETSLIFAVIDAVVVALSIMAVKLFAAFAEKHKWPAAAETIGICLILYGPLILVMIAATSAGITYNWNN